MTPSPRRLAWIIPAALALVVGCEDEPKQARKARIKPREVLGKTTQDIRPAAPELEKGGAQQAPMKITAKDPLTISGNAYVVAVDKIAALNVQHAIDLYQAMNGDYPKTYQEFMDGVIKPGQPDGIQLPQLPYYQEYGYDEKNHKLIILEYPDRKAAFEKQPVR
jgi:hypothetical protein